MASSKPTILYVDDEPSNLTVFRSTFRRQFNVLLADSGEEGLSIIYKEPEIEVIVSDQRMPTMTGVEMLSKAREIKPDSIRMLLTAYTDVNDIIDSINKGNIYRFVTKPWSEDDLRMTLQRASETYQLVQKNKHLQDELIKAERAASIGKVASAVGHEIRNQLSFGMAVELIRNDHPDDANIQRYSEMILGARDHILRLLDDIRRFSKDEGDDMSLKMEKRSLCDTIEKTVAFARFDNSLKDIDIVEDYNVCADITFDHARLSQVVLNLLRNAGDACGPEGQVVVSLRSDETNAIVDVKDNGSGIPPEYINHIWEPFFTTKGDKGLGLGLDICKAIIERHGGQISCESVVREGATFTIRLPLR